MVAKLGPTGAVRSRAGSGHSQVRSGPGRRRSGARRRGRRRAGGAAGTERTHPAISTPVSSTRAVPPARAPGRWRGTNTAAFGDADEKGQAGAGQREHEVGGRAGGPARSRRRPARRARSAATRSARRPARPAPRRGPRARRPAPAPHRVPTAATPPRTSNAPTPRTAPGAPAGAAAASSAERAHRERHRRWSTTHQVYASGGGTQSRVPRDHHRVDAVAQRDRPVADPVLPVRVRRAPRRCTDSRHSARWSCQRAVGPSSILATAAGRPGRRSAGSAVSPAMVRFRYVAGERLFS